MTKPPISSVLFVAAPFYFITIKRYDGFAEPHIESALGASRAHLPAGDQGRESATSCS